jgi:hypothetical protein
MMKELPDHSQIARTDQTREKHTQNEKTQIPQLTPIQPLTDNSRLAK